MAISISVKINPSPTFGLFRAGYIYTLNCPETNTVRYVGKSFSLTKRIYKHLNVKSSERTKRANWIKSLAKRGKLPIIEIIDDCDEFNWSKKEKDYIKLYKACGANLLNMTIGGESGALNFNHEDDTRKRISEKMKALKKEDAHNKNVSNSIKNKWRTDTEYRDLQTKNNMKKISNMTAEHRKKAGEMKSKMAKMPISEKIELCNNIRTQINMGRKRVDVATEFKISYGILKELLKKY